MGSKSAVQDRLDVQSDAPAPPFTSSLPDEGFFLLEFTNFERIYVMAKKIKNDKKVKVAFLGGFLCFLS